MYILTNPKKTVLYTGVTNDLKRRVREHIKDRDNSAHFAEKYFCHKLIYFEIFQHVEDAIRREKEIKTFSHSKKKN